MLKKTKRYEKHFLVLVAAFFGVAFIVPIIVTVTNSLMTAFEIQNRYGMDVLPTNVLHLLDVSETTHFVRMTLVPNWLSLGQYFSLLFETAQHLTAFWNSVRIAVPSVLGQLAVAIPAAYAFEYWQFRHKEKIFFLYIVVMLMPLPVVLVPQFIMAGYLHIQESVLAIILPAVFNPFGVFLLRQFLKNLPVEYIEAAKIDGASQPRILWSIVAPMLKPAIAALGILIFIDYWNVVEQAIVFITDINREPMSVSFHRLRHEYEIIFAASVFYMLPALLVFLYGQEYLSEGIQLSGIK